MMSKGKGGEVILVGSKLGSTWLGAEGYCSWFLTQSDVDCFCSSPLPVSTHTSLHFGTVQVNGMLGLVGLVGMNCYAIPWVPLFHK